MTITEKTKSAASSAVFYIVTNTDAFEDCGFKSQNETAPDGATMTGFMRCKLKISCSQPVSSERAIRVSTKN